MSSMPSSSVLQAKRQQELHGPYQESGGNERQKSPNRIQPKYTEPERTSSSSYKPPMSREALRKAKVKVSEPVESHNSSQQQPSSSSLSSALSFFKNVFTGRTTSETQATTSVSSTTLGKATVIKLIEESSTSGKTNGPAAESLDESKSKGNEGDNGIHDADSKKEASDSEKASSKSIVSEEQQHADAAAEKKEKFEKAKSRRPAVPFSYDPRKLRPALDIAKVSENEDNLPYPQPTWLPSQPSDGPMDSQWEARKKKIEQFKRRHLILPPTVIEPEVSDRAIATTEVKSQYVDSTKPEYIFPPREIKSRLNTAGKPSSPGLKATANSKWHKDDSRDVHHIADRRHSQTKMSQRQGRRSPPKSGPIKSRQKSPTTKKFAYIPPTEAAVPMIEKGESGGTTSFKASSSPVAGDFQRHSTSSAKRQSVPYNNLQPSPKLPENRWQKSPPVSREGSSQKSRIRSKSTPDRSFFSARAANNSTKSAGRAKSIGTKESRSQTSFIDDRDAPMIYQSVTPNTNSRTQRSMKIQGSKSARKNASLTQQSRSPAWHAKTNDTKSPSSNRRVVNRMQSPTTARRPSSPVARASPSDHMGTSSYVARSANTKSQTQPTPPTSRRATSPTSNSPASSRRSMSNQQSPVTGRRSMTNQQSPGASQRSMSNQQPPVTSRRSMTNQQSPVTRQRSLTNQQSPVTKRRSMSNQQSPQSTIKYNQQSPASARRSMTNQQSPSSYHHSPKRSSSRPSSPRRPRTPANHSNINSKSSFKTSPTGRQGNKKNVITGQRSGFPQKGSPMRSMSSQSHGDSSSKRDDRDFDHVTREKPTKKASRTQQANNKYYSKSSSSSLNNQSNKQNSQPPWVTKNQYPKKSKSQSKAPNQPAWIQKNMHHSRQEMQSTFPSRSRPVNNDSVKSPLTPQNQQLPYTVEPGPAFDRQFSSLRPPRELVESSPKERIQKSPSFKENISPTVLPSEYKYDSIACYPSPPSPTLLVPSLSETDHVIQTSPPKVTLSPKPTSSEGGPPETPLDRFEAINISPITFEALSFKSHSGPVLPTYVDYTKGGFEMDEAKDDNEDAMYASQEYASNLSIDNAPEKDILNSGECVEDLERALQNNGKSSDTNVDGDEGISFDTNFNAIELNRSNSASSSVSCKEGDLFLNVFNPIVDDLQMEDVNEMDRSNSSLYGAPTRADDQSQLYRGMLQETSLDDDDMPEPSGASSKAQLKGLQSKVSNTPQAFSGNPQTLSVGQSSPGGPASVSKGILVSASVSPEQVSNRSDYRKNEPRLDNPTKREKSVGNVKRAAGGKQAWNVNNSPNSKRQECTACSPLSSKGLDKEPRPDPKPKSPRLKDITTVSPLTNRSQRVTKARRESLQKIVTRRSPPTQISPLQFRRDVEEEREHQRERYNSQQQQLTWGKNAAAMGAGASAAGVGVKMAEIGKGKDASTHKYTSHQTELTPSLDTIEKEAHSGSVMKKTFSFFSSLFHGKEHNTPEEPVAQIEEKELVRDERLTARPEYSSNGTTYSTFHESLRKNRAPTPPLLIPKAQSHDPQSDEYKSVPTLTPTAGSSESDEDLAAFPKADKHPYLSKAAFPSAATKMGEMP